MATVHKNTIAVANSVVHFNVELWIDNPNVTGVTGMVLLILLLVADLSH